MPDNKTALAKWILRNMPKCPFDGHKNIDFGKCPGFREPGCLECVLANAAKLAAPDDTAAMAGWIVRNASCCPFEIEDIRNDECAGFAEPGCAGCLAAHAALLDPDKKNGPVDGMGNDMSGLKPGDYVMYRNGARIEFGRVKRVDFDRKKAWVWYSEGDTASCTRFEDLVMLANGYVLMDTNLGGAAAQAMFPKAR